MKKEALSGVGEAQLEARRAELLDLQLSRFAQGKSPYWPLVKKEMLAPVWSEFSQTGKVRRESMLDQILTDMRDCCALLSVATHVAEHGPCSTADYLKQHIEDGKITANKLEDFVGWLIEDDSGFWRISDYGLPKLEQAICLAIETKDLAARVKYLDRALNVVHQRGDLARLFIEGGRSTVVAMAASPIDQTDELIDGSLIRDEHGALYRVHYQRNALIIAHPIVDGVPQVNADTTVRFWVDGGRPPSGDNDRQEPVYYVAANAYDYLKSLGSPAAASSSSAPSPLRYRDQIPALQGDTAEAMSEWLKQMHERDALMHPDNEASDVLSLSDDLPLFSPEQATHVQVIVDKILDLHGDLVYQAALALLVDVNGTGHEGAQALCEVEMR